MNTHAWTAQVAKNSNMPNAMSLNVTHTQRMLKADFSMAPLAPYRGRVTYEARPGTQGMTVGACFTCHSAIVLVYV